MKHLINWMEIPVLDMGRAVSFYKKILGIEFHQMQMGDIQYAIFPSEDKFNGGALACGPHYQPGTGGLTVYLDGGEDLNNILLKVPEAGGEIMMAKTFLAPEAGYIGFFIDSEGNKIGLQNS